MPDHRRGSGIKCLRGSAAGGKSKEGAGFLKGAGKSQGVGVQGRGETHGGGLGVGARGCGLSGSWLPGSRRI